MAAARRLFTEQAYGDVSVDTIADAAGVTKGAFYYWFRDKADVARDVRHQLFDEATAQAMTTLPADADVLAALEAGFSRFLLALANLGDARGFLLETWRMPADDEGPFDQEHGVALVAGMLRGGIERGEVTPIDPDAVAVFLVGGCSELARYALESWQTTVAVETLRQLIDSFRPAPSANRRRRAVSVRGR